MGNDSMFLRLTEIAAAVAFSFGLLGMVTVAVHQFAHAAAPVEIWLLVVLGATAALWAALEIPRLRPDRSPVSEDTSQTSDSET